MNEMKAEKVLHIYNWQDVVSQHPITNYEIVSMDGESVLKIESTNPPPARQVYGQFSGSI